MSERCYLYPPNLKQHLLNDHSNQYTHEEQETLKDRPPEIFLLFLGVGALFVVIQSLLILPALWRLRKAGELLRSSKNGVMFPPGIRSAIILTSLPLVCSILEYISLLCPLWTFQCQFLLSLYASFSIYLTSRMITNHNAQIRSLDALWLFLSDDRNHGYYSHHCTKAPLCVCFSCFVYDSWCHRMICSHQCCQDCCGSNKTDNNNTIGLMSDEEMIVNARVNRTDNCCCMWPFKWANRKVSKFDIRLIDNCIIQFPLLSPMLNFFIFQNEVTKDNFIYKLGTVCTIISVVTCMTALSALASLVTDYINLRKQTPVWKREMKRAEDRSDASNIDGSSISETNDEIMMGNDYSITESSSAEQSTIQPTLDNFEMITSMNQGSNKELVNDTPVALKLRSVGSVLGTVFMPRLIIRLIGVNSLHHLRGRIYTSDVMTESYAAFVAIVLVTVHCFRLPKVFNVKECVSHAKKSYRFILPNKEDRLYESLSYI